MWKRRRESERKEGEEGRREGGLKEEENSGIEGDGSDGVYLEGGWGDRRGRSKGGRTGKWRVRRGRLRRDGGERMFYRMQWLLSFSLSFRGINFVLSALVFNVFPTIFEVSLVTGILVRM